MAFVMTKDGKVRSAQVSDLKEVAERDERINQLKRQCAVLAAEVDRARPIVQAAQAWYNGASNWSVTLAESVAAYEAAKEQGNGISTR